MVNKGASKKVVKTPTRAEFAAIRVFGVRDELQEC
jgi:hypothetical protein